MQTTWEYKLKTKAKISWGKLKEKRKSVCCAFKTLCPLKVYIMDIQMYSTQAFIFILYMYKKHIKKSERSAHYHTWVINQCGLYNCCGQIGGQTNMLIYTDGLNCRQ